MCGVSVLVEVLCFAFVLQLRAARHQQEESTEDSRAAQDGRPRVQPHHGVRWHQRRWSGRGLRGAHRLGPRPAGQQPAGRPETRGWNRWTDCILFVRFNMLQVFIMAFFIFIFWIFYFLLSHSFGLDITHSNYGRKYNTTDLKISIRIPKWTWRLMKRCFSVNTIK